MHSDEINGITIIIPTRNRIKELNNCLFSVMRSVNGFKKENPSKIVEILIIDDSSSVSIEEAIEKTERTRVIKNKGIGPGAARNTGIENAKTGIIAFIDSDCTAHKDWVREIYCFFKNNQELAVQGAPYYFSHKNNPALGECEERLYKAMFSTYLRGSDCLQIDTRNFAIRSKLLKQLNEPLFTENMQKAQAEARVCGLKLIKNGISIGWSEKIKVFHEDPASIYSAMKQKYRHGSGRIYVWEKTPPLSYLLSRYFIKPIFTWKVPIWYVIPTHTAFLAGYFVNCIKKRLVKKILSINKTAWLSLFHFLVFSPESFAAALPAFSGKPSG